MYSCPLQKSDEASQAKKLSYAICKLQCPSQQFFSLVGTEPPLPGYYQYFRGVKCLAQGHNMAEVGFEPPTSRSGVRYSTTEPPCSSVIQWIRHVINNIMTTHVLSLSERTSTMHFSLKNVHFKVNRKLF